MKEKIENTELCCGAYLLATSKIVKESITFASENAEYPKPSNFYLDVQLDISEIDYDKKLEVKIKKKVGVLSYKVITTTLIKIKGKFIPMLEIKINMDKLKITNMFNKHSLERTFENDYTNTTGIRERNKLIFDIAHNLAKEFL